MHEGFKKHLLDKVLDWGNEAKEITSFLLENDPEQLKFAIMMNLQEWADLYSLFEGEAVKIEDSNIEACAEEIMEGYREILKDHSPTPDNVVPMQ